MKKAFNIPQEEIDNGNVQVVRVLSTAHMTPQDDKLLTNQGVKFFGLVVRNVDPGWLFTLNEPGDELDEALAQMRKHGLSSQLVALVQIIACEGYTHLRLDPDANEDPGFPTHTW